MKRYELVFFLFFLVMVNTSYCDDTEKSLFLFEAIIDGNLPKVKEIILQNKPKREANFLKYLFIRKKEGLENSVFYYCYKSCKYSDLFSSLSLKNYFMPIHLAAALGKLDIVKYLVEDEKIDVNTRFVKPTAIYYACANGQMDVLLYLLSKKAYLIDKDGENSLMTIACANGHVNIVKFLMGKNFDINAKINGKTLLHVACENGQAKVVKFLLDHKANVNKESDEFEKYFPIHYAFKNGSLEVIKVLLKDGSDFHDNDIDINKRDKFNDLPIELAIRFSDKSDEEKFKIVRYLVKNLSNFATLPTDLSTDGSDIRNYVKMYHDFEGASQDGIEGRINFILKNLKDKEFDEVKSKYLLDMALAVSIYDLKEEYPKFCMQLWRKIYHDENLKSIIFKLLKIDNNFAKSSYVDLINFKIKKSFLPKEDKEKLLKSLVCENSQDDFKQNLFSSTKNSSIENSNDVNSKFRDLKIVL